MRMWCCSTQANFIFRASLYESVDVVKLIPVARVPLSNINWVTLKSPRHVEMCMLYWIELYISAYHRNAQQEGREEYDLQGWAMTEKSLLILCFVWAERHFDRKGLSCEHRVLLYRRHLWFPLNEYLCLAARTPPLMRWEEGRDQEEDRC